MWRDLGIEGSVAVLSFIISGILRMKDAGITAQAGGYLANIRQQDARYNDGQDAGIPAATTREYSDNSF